jgi:hypothetical protein
MVIVLIREDLIYPICYEMIAVSHTIHLMIELPIYDYRNDNTTAVMQMKGWKVEEPTEQVHRMQQ